MQRFFLPAGALVLVVLTACGAAHIAAPRATRVAAHVPSIKALVARRTAAAHGEAGQLLQDFAVPPGAKLVHGWPSDYGFHSRIPDTGPLGEVVDLHRFWVSRAGLAAIASFEKSRVPSGFKSSANGENAAGSFTQLTFDSPPSGITTRDLVISISQRRTRTILRVDAQVVWVYPRSPKEKVPAGVTAIHVTAPKVSAWVTDGEEVRRIVSWFDALPISPPGVSVPCPLVVGDSVNVAFLVHRRRVALAQVPAGTAGVCNQIAFAIRGKQQAPLIDSPGPSFASRLQHLLGVNLGVR